MPEKGRVLGCDQHVYVIQRLRFVREENSLKAKLHQSGDQRAEPLQSSADTVASLGSHRYLGEAASSLVVLKQSQELSTKMPVRVLWLWPQGKVVPSGLRAPAKQHVRSNLPELGENLKSFLE